MQCVFGIFFCGSLNEDWVEAVEMIWPVATPVGGSAHLGTLFSSNWGISFSFFMKEHGLTLSLSVSLSLFHLTESCGVFSFPCTMSQPLLSFGPLIFTKSLGEFSLSWLARVLHLFSLPLSDLSVGEWQQDSSSGNTSRVLSYTIALNNPLGPKTAPVVETQVSPWQTLAFFSFVI